MLEHPSDTEGLERDENPAKTTDGGRWGIRQGCHESQVEKVSQGGGAISCVKLSRDVE